MRQLFLNPPTSRPEPKIPTDRPVYRVLDEKGFFGPDDTLHREGEVIVLWDEPNMEMEPLNEMAKERFEKAATKLELSGREVANFNGRYFAPTATKEDMIDNATSDARRVRSLSNPDGKAIMGAKKDVSDRISSPEQEAIPETGAKHRNERRAKIETVSG